MDYHAQGKDQGRPWALGIAGLFLATVLVGMGCRPSDQQEVVVYTSQDRVYSEPILKAFGKETGLQVSPLYDSEAVKTVGLARRLLEERRRPRCDVFWNNEELQTRQLAARGVFRETDGWVSMGYRTRRLVVNTNRIPVEEGPQSFRALADEEWRGRFAMAYPLFGTTLTHFLVLRDQWGEDDWRSWCEALQANEPMVVDGNSVVVRMVGRGEVPVGLTDSDDIAAGRRQDYPIVSLPLVEDSVLIHNTVGIIRDAPHPEAAERLADYLQSEAVQQKLLEADAIEGTGRVEGVIHPEEVDWESVLADLEQATETLETIFVR